ncbi:Hypothetical predicted protein [Pelobates cultripes]|uniref:Uncharacterized protein n=1 Tax=Pelobates cultripes TaxID=61616 RepID=A0AAD1R1R0_PELCU|nr:Hypothetical predicted protein [Pelobates cultripes]
MRERKDLTRFYDGIGGRLAGEATSPGDLGTIGGANFHIKSRDLVTVSSRDPESANDLRQFTPTGKWLIGQLGSSWTGC